MFCRYSERKEDGAPNLRKDSRVGKLIIVAYHQAPLPPTLGKDVVLFQQRRHMEPNDARNREKREKTMKAIKYATCPKKLL